MLAPYAPISSIAVEGPGAPEDLGVPVLLDTAYFATTANDGTSAGLRVTIASDGVVAQLISPSGQVRESVGPIRVGGATGGFPSEWRVVLADRTLLVSSQTEQRSVDLSEDRTVVLNWAEATGAAAPGLALTVDLSGGALDAAGPLHAWAVVVALLLIAIAVGWLWSPKPRQLWASIRLWRLRRVDAVVLLCLVFSGFVSRTTYDDGWLLLWGRDLAANGWGPSTPFMHELGSSVHLFQGFLYSSLLGFTSGQSDAVIGIRLLTIVMIALAWLALSRAVLPRLFPDGRTHIHWAAAAYVVLFGFGWMTLRTEIPIFLISIALLAIAAKKGWRYPALRIVGMCSLTAAGIATHPVGLMLLLPLLIVLIPELTRSSTPRFDVVVGLILGAASGVVIVFFNQSLALFLRGLDEYGDIPLDPFNEWGRFSDMMRIGTITQRAWFVAGVLGVLALWAVASRTLLSPRRYDRRDLIIFATAVMPFGIALTASKWLWHYAALMAPMTIGLLFVVDWVARSPRQRTLVVVVTVAVAGWMGLAVRDSEFDRQWTAWLTLGAAILACSAMLLRRWDPRLRVAMALWVVTVLTAGVTTWHAIDLTVRSPSAWSFLKQSTVGLVDVDLRCGLSTVIDIPGGGGSTAHDVILGSGFTPAVQYDFTLQNPCYFPPAREKGAWQPAFGSILTADPQDPSIWLHTDELRSGCVDVAGPGTYVYPYCFRESLPSGTPQLPAVLVE